MFNNLQTFVEYKTSEVYIACARGLNETESNK